MEFKRLCTIGLMMLGIIALGGQVDAKNPPPHPYPNMNSGPYYALPSWDQKLNVTDRFILLSDWNNEAVLDKETGLVWEASPSSSPHAWFNATRACVAKNVGGRLGWRLPTIQELASLVDPTQKNTPAHPAPKLPSGAPFSNVSVKAPKDEKGGEFNAAFYWSATNYVEMTKTDKEIRTMPVMWYMDFATGQPGASGLIDYASDIYYLRYVWCVRGGQGVNYPQ